MAMKSDSEICALLRASPGNATDVALAAGYGADGLRRRLKSMAAQGKIRSHQTSVGVVYSALDGELEEHKQADPAGSRVDSARRLLEIEEQIADLEHARREMLEALSSA